MTVLIALPVKIAASCANAKRTGLAWCCLAVVAGLIAGYLAASLLGGFIGGPLAGFLGFVLGMRLILGTSYVAALGLSVIAFGLAMVGFAILVKIGIFVSGPTATTIAT